MPTGQRSSELNHATLYDAIYESQDADISVYRELALQSTGAVLELGAGTGRLLAPLLTQGVDAWGLECDPAMLASGRRRLAEVGGPNLSARLLAGDMRSFELDQSFSLVVVAANTLSLMIEERELAATLERARAHLSGEGALAFDVSVVEGHVWHKPPFTWTGPTEAVWIGGNAATSFEAGHYDPQTRMCELTRQFQLVDGRAAQTRTITRQRSVAQLLQAVEAAGLRAQPPVDERGQPVGAQSTRAFFRCTA